VLEAERTRKLLANKYAHLALLLPLTRAVTIGETMTDSFNSEGQSMTGRQITLDGRPGALPDIHTDVRGITYVMAPSGAPRSKQLVIRCDADGEVWASIQAAPDVAQ